MPAIPSEINPIAGSAIIGPGADPRHQLEADHDDDAPYNKKISVIKVTMTRPD